ncbi:MAG: sigma-54 dependent transcriptional regulator [Gemmatimonadota bacterium]
MTILIVDDEANLRRMLRALLEEESYGVIEAGSAEEGLRLVEEHRPETILLDLVLPGESGLDALPRFREALPDAQVVMMSGEATLSDAARATREGAFHFLEKPLGPEAVLATVRSAREVSRARDLSRALQEELGPGTRLIGSSPPMERVRETIRKVAPTDSRVLILGESGTGKELAAAAIHALSSRKNEPFVRVNSAAIPRDLVESEMFGHERGAFTGAESRRRGRFELADGGTLFLDEVGDLGAGAQSKLLRALESGTIERLGGSTSIEVDVRVLAATNRDLQKDVEEGRFREDLLFRLEVVPLRMPPLREHPEDLPALVEHIVQRLRRKQGLSPPELTEDAMTALAVHSWPGNVRELLNLVERLAILHSGGRVEADDVRHHLSSRQRGLATSAYRPDDSRTLRERLDDFEAELIRSAIVDAGENLAEAARRLRTDRANLYRRMKRLGLKDGP